jgi:hypothetical protein
MVEEGFRPAAAGAVDRCTPRADMVAARTCKHSRARRGVEGAALCEREGACEMRIRWVGSRAGRFHKVHVSHRVSKPRNPKGRSRAIWTSQS